ncbi:MAG: tRNA (adenosine(37)-N6)-threonylcarbamoyltransferase complex dimerization subunit type 1 TsaB [Bacilli bacterium]|nr:tRNA (adenosine(37)-N6)-threonylcarbamoyltransferase complex dimerization subunit type 1 TsaB [Bacilli bacterium]
MITIILDSSNTSLSVGLAKDNKLLASKSYKCWQEQSEHMIPELDDLLRKNNVDKNEISEIVVSIGPGSYTGVRIALTIAKVLALSTNALVYPVSSLRALSTINEPSICLINARSGRSYIGVYDKQSILLSDRILTNDDVLDYIKMNPSYKIRGEVSYLGFNDTDTNVCETMLHLKQFTKPVDNVLGLKPVYMKD